MIIEAEGLIGTWLAKVSEAGAKVLTADTQSYVKEGESMPGTAPSSGQRGLCTPPEPRLCPFEER